MADLELYEKLRLLLKGGLPKHDVTYKLVSNMYTEEEAKILVSSFKKAGKVIPIREIAKLSGVARDELKEILNNMHNKGKLTKLGSSYLLLPYLPGGFEFYFTIGKDDPERMKKVAEAHLELFKLGFALELSASEHTVYRVIPTVDPIEKSIEINENLAIQHQVMPYEILRKYLANINPKIYTVVPCSCRTAAKLAGEPCKQTNDNYCVTAGTLAQIVNKQGIGREVTLDELMEIMERAEKEGLVHETFNMQDTATFICNCCSCCCGFLKSVKEQSNYGAITKSNFDPIINRDLCTLCETCMKICPMNAIYHHWPHKKDLTDDFMKIRLALCIGCGVCASNCPSEAISLEKVRNIIPIKGQGEMRAKLTEERAH